MPERSRQERAVVTRRRILQAAVDCLIEYGHAGTTMQRVQDRAGVSRGTLTHHYGSINALLGAAIHYIADQQMVDIERGLDQPLQPKSAREVVQVLKPSMTGPLFTAGLELWAAARTNSDLQAILLPAERELGRKLRSALGASLSEADFGVLLSLFRGQALTAVLRPGTEKASNELERWAELVDLANAQTPG